MRRYMVKLGVLVTTLGLLIGLAPAAQAATPIGNFESITAIPGGIRVNGWALDPDTTASIDVHVYINGFLAGAGKADQSRPDVDAVHHKGANHGFNVNVPSPGGTVCVWAIDSGGKGPNIRIGCRSFPATAQPIGSFDGTTPAQNGINVIGWALDPDSTAPIDVHVYLNNKLVGAATANLSRPDVDAVHHKGANHGFNFRIGTTGGTVCVFAINFGGGVNPRLGCRNVPATAAPIGFVDAISPEAGGARAIGWALDPDTNAPIEVHAYFNEVLARIVLADQSRPDVDAAYHKGANHGFNFHVPKSGPGVVCIYAVNFGGGDNTLLKCQQV